MVGFIHERSEVICRHQFIITYWQRLHQQNKSSIPCQSQDNNSCGNSNARCSLYQTALKCPPSVQAQQGSCRPAVLDTGETPVVVTSAMEFTSSMSKEEMFGSEPQTLPVKITWPCLLFFVICGLLGHLYPVTEGSHRCLGHTDVCLLNEQTIDDGQGLRRHCYSGSRWRNESDSIAIKIIIFF